MVFLSATISVFNLKSLERTDADELQLRFPKRGRPGPFRSQVVGNLGVCLLRIQISIRPGLSPSPVQLAESQFDVPTQQRQQIAGGSLLQPNRLSTAA